MVFPVIPAKAAMRKRSNNNIARLVIGLGLLLFCFVFSGCAAMGKMVKPDAWLGMADIAVAGGIIAYIFNTEQEISD
jgi:hypothetical protein